MTVEGSRPSLPSIPAAAVLGVNAEKAKGNIPAEKKCTIDTRINALSKSIYAKARETVVSEYRAQRDETYQARKATQWTWVANIRYVFDKLFSNFFGKLDNEAKSRENAVLSALNTAVKAAELSRGIGSFERGVSQQADQKTEAGIPTGDTAAFHTSLRAADPKQAAAAHQAIQHQDTYVKNLASALVKAGGGDIGFLNGVLDAITPTEAESADTNLKMAAPNVLLNLRREVVQQSAKKVLETLFNDFPTVPNRTEVENVAIAFAKSLKADESYGLDAGLSDDQIKARLGKTIDQFLAEFRARVVSGTPGAGSQVRAAVAEAQASYGKALEMGPVLETFMADVTQARTKWQGLEDEYKKVKADLTQALRGRATAIDIKLKEALDRNRVGIRDDSGISRAHPQRARSGSVDDSSVRSQKRTQATEDAKLVAFEAVKKEHPVREQNIAALISKLDTLKAKAGAAKVEYLRSISRLEEKAQQQANAAQIQHNAIRQKARDLLGDNGFHIIEKEGVKMVVNENTEGATHITTEDQVLELWGIKFDNENVDGDAFNVEKTKTALINAAQATPEFRGAAVVAMHEVMHAIALNKKMEAEIPGIVDGLHLKDVPYASKMIDRRGGERAEYLEFARQALSTNGFSNTLRTQMNEDINTYFGLVWNEISEPSAENPEVRVLKEAYANMECFKEYTGCEHGQVLATHNIKDIALREAAKKFAEGVKAKALAEETARQRAAAELRGSADEEAAGRADALAPVDAPEEADGVAAPEQQGNTGWFNFSLPQFNLPKVPSFSARFAGSNPSQSPRVETAPADESDSNGADADDTASVSSNGSAAAPQRTWAEWIQSLKPSFGGNQPQHPSAQVEEEEHVVDAPEAEHA